ncbi:hypothetical protein V8C35DRAFT_333163 [Trichoderma chlorosporum]
MLVRRAKRKILTCSRCRLLKLQCDQSKPSCQRCSKAKVICSPGACSSAEGPYTGLSNLVAEAPLQPAAAQSLSLFVLQEQQKPSINNGDIHNVQEPTLVKKRQRAQLSCIRCHRLKVKCNRDLPCLRCRTSGFGKFCEYHHRIEKASASSGDDPPKMVYDPETPIKSWHTQRRSATHWSELLSTLKIQAMQTDLPVCRLISDLIHQQKTTNTSNASLLPSNFPFNSPRAANLIYMDTVQDLLQQHRGKCQSYLDGYFSLYQPSYPIIDASIFSTLVDQFWNDPRSTDMSWLASFLMVLALGCFAVTRDQDVTTEFCMAAEACLSKTPFMIQADLVTIRTLCLMVLAKQTINATCRTFDSCWTLLGIVTRAAIGMDLHRQSIPHNQSLEEMRSRQYDQTLWSIIVYFCVQIATITGKPLLVPPDMLTEFGPLSTVQVDDPWIKLIEAYPRICHIISRITNDTEKPLYDEVLKHNDHVRQLMDSLLGNIHGKPRLYTTLDIFFRQILLVLHRSHALHPAGPFDYPVSYWASLECGLAILVHHRDLEEQIGPDSTDLLGRLFKLDILSAMLTVCLHLLRHEAPLSAGLILPPRRIILNTLQACLNIWEREIHYSTCFRIGHMLLVSVLKLLPDISPIEN